MSQQFELVSEFAPAGDQPAAIKKLVEGLTEGKRHQALLGATGTGKTFTMANVIQQVQRPTLVMCHNKTLAAQLASEFRSFFPNNAVCYFVSYYDYYQPESYMVGSDTFIEKDASINEEINKFRHASTMNLLTRKDVIIVSSVSCIYGLGDVTDYKEMRIEVEVGGMYKRNKLLYQLADIHFDRNDIDFKRGTYRVRGDSIDIFPSYCDHFIRLEFFGDELEQIAFIEPITGEVLSSEQKAEVYPAKHTVTSQEKLRNVSIGVEAEMHARVAELQAQGKIVEAQRIQQRTEFDLEMMMETGYCNGIENYTRYLSGRPAGAPPATLIEYFPKDFLLFIDESHITIPQIGAMWGGNKSRKDNLINYGFRLPSAYDNRPLTFDEFEGLASQAVYVSATPAKYEKKHCEGEFIQQIIRPTGLLDPLVEVRPEEGQMDDLLNEIKITLAKNERVLITTITKRMAEELTDFLQELNHKVRYLHSEIDTVERIEILRDLRLGVIDIVVGINLLREGLDLPEVSLIVILDADKKGFLRSRDALIQTIGRAARNSGGHVIMYARVVTDSMEQAMDETSRRRVIQMAYNKKHGITPTTIIKEIKELEFTKRSGKDKGMDFMDVPKDEAFRLLDELNSQMELAVRDMEFEKAADFRDRIESLEKQMMK